LTKSSFIAAIGSASTDEAVYSPFANLTNLEVEVEVEAAEAVEALVDGGSAETDMERAS